MASTGSTANEQVDYVFKKVLIGDSAVGLQFYKKSLYSACWFKAVSPRLPAGNYPVAHVSYELNVLGFKVRPLMNAPPPVMS
ncbi:hypothetical protein Syun_006219 [Stephania yunnanensis]|uniref:Uncharacterized protein n=1 Tax=Stephania yunnanensis TaxID=152371 RepID=A0AAP0PXC7_9MAGN